MSDVGLEEAALTRGVCQERTGRRVGDPGYRSRTGRWYSVTAQAHFRYEWPMATTAADRRVRTFEEFVKAVMEFSDEDEVLFRGQRRADWDLSPSIARMKLRTHSTLRELEDRLVRDFRRECPPFIQQPIPDAWEQLAIAQHHGLATRLLDWTANPLAALWFAVKDPGIGRQPGLVLMFALEPSDHVADRESTSPFAIRRTKFFQPGHLTPRIVAQAGWFSVHAWNSRGQRYSRMNHLSSYSSRIERLIIPPASFAALRAALDRMGVNHASLFPDINGLTQHLNWRHGLLPDEGGSTA